MENMHIINIEKRLVLGVRAYKFTITYARNETKRLTKTNKQIIQKKIIFKVFLITK